LVSDDFIERMKKGAYLVNTARGELVNEMAVLRALQSGKLGGVALDAMAKEPPDPANPLFSFQNVITTPHLGAQTDGAVNQMGRLALNDCLAVLAGNSPTYPVN
jgi:D-3-phosphoglycerate dehydrogenase